MNIDVWLYTFKNSWEKKHINHVMSLFADDVIYYETPFHKLHNLDEVKKEWMVIENQNEIDLHYSVFSKEDNKYTIQWDLKYFDKDKNFFHLRGIYLIKLDKNGLCYEFRHYCEKDNI